MREEEERIEFERKLAEEKARLEQEQRRQMDDVGSDDEYGEEQA